MLYLCLLCDYVVQKNDHLSGISRFSEIFTTMGSSSNDGALTPFSKQMRPKWLILKNKLPFLSVLTFFLRLRVAASAEQGRQCL